MKEYYVYFTQETGKIRSVFVERNIKCRGHDYNISLSIGGTWNICGLTASFYNPNAFPIYVDHIRTTNLFSEIIKFTVKKSRFEKRALFLMPTCVSIVKWIIGVRNPLVLTPQQLSKYLLNLSKEQPDIYSAEVIHGSTRIK